MRTLTQPLLAIEIVDFGAEDIGRQHARAPTPWQGEIDGIREAVELNWLEVERLGQSQTDSRAIRGRVAGLVDTLGGGSPRRGDKRIDLVRLTAKTAF